MTGRNKITLALIIVFTLGAILSAVERKWLMAALQAMIVLAYIPILLRRLKAEKAPKVDVFN